MLQGFRVKKFGAVSVLRVAYTMVSYPAMAYSMAFSRNILREKGHVVRIFVYPFHSKR